MYNDINTDFLQKYVQKDYEELSNMPEKIVFYMNTLSSMYSSIILTNTVNNSLQSIYLPNSKSKSISVALDFLSQ